MQKAKRILAVLLAMAMLCGFAAFGVSAAEEEPFPLPVIISDEQMVELQGYMKIVIPIAILELALQRVPRWLNWAVFARGSSYAAFEADLRAELEKTGIGYDEYLEWLLTGDIMAHWEETLAFAKALAEKGPDIIKKHCAFYIGWWFDCLTWIIGPVGIMPLFV